MSPEASPRPQTTGGVGHSLLGLSHIGRAPKWSFNGRRNQSREGGGPGPGAYNLVSPDATSRFGKSPNSMFGLSGRESSDKQRVPGPGAYSDKRGIGVGAGKCYSLTPRRDGKARDGKDFPGPGAHSIKSTIGNGPCYSASSRRPLNAKELGPGPGEYNQMDETVAEKQPSWGFGSSQRPDTASGAQAATPGPGAYLMGSAVGEGPKFSMQARRNAPRPHPSPGPGAHGGLYTQFADQ